MVKCEYCNKEYDNLTNEHIFPNFFYEILGLKNNKVKYLSFNESFNISSRKELFIKKVCATCNNIVLSKLDIEFASLIKPFILNDTFSTENIDYDKVIRWLIKTFFNSYLYINQKSVIELYKNNYINSILKEKLIERELLFSITLKGNNLNNSFMSIGTILEPRKIVKYLDIYNFFQIKNHMFILVIFKKPKYYKKHSKEVIQYLKNEYNATYHKKILKLDNNTKEKLPIQYIYNANEDDTNIPFKLLCKLQWNIHNKINSIYDDVMQIVNDPIESRLLVSQYDSNTNALYSSSKSLLISLDNIAILLHFNNDSQITRYAYDICNYKYNEIIKVQEYKDANITLNRYDNMTLLKMHDLNDIKNPFIRSLHVPQNQINWDNFKKNIKEQDNFIYIAKSKSKVLEKQLDNKSVKNIIFISKVKVTQV